MSNDLFDKLWPLPPGWFRRGVESRHWLEAFTELLDEVRTALYDARRMWLVKTAPDTVLDLHGQARDIERYPGESAEAYRARLLQAFDLHLEGGTNPGLVRAMKALGYVAEVIELFKFGSAALHNAQYNHNGQLTHSGKQNLFKFDILVHLAADQGLTALELARIKREIRNRKAAHAMMSALELDLAALVAGSDLAPAPVDSPMTVTATTWNLHDGTFQHDATINHDAASSAQQVA